MEKHKVILLVEDNKQDELLTVRAFKKNGIRHEIVVCRDGEQALDWLFVRGQYADRDPHVCPVVILLDLKMPKLSGHEVLAEIRKHPRTKRLPVVILTTSTEESDITASYDGGANSFVQKPIDFNDFSEAVKNLGVYWLLLNQPPTLADVGN